MAETEARDFCFSEVPRVGGKSVGQWTGLWQVGPCFCAKQLARVKILVLSESLKAAHKGGVVWPCLRGKLDRRIQLGFRWVWGTFS